MDGDGTRVDALVNLASALIPPVGHPAGWARRSGTTVKARTTESAALALLGAWLAWVVVTASLHYRT